jgi:hypothetical protein
MKYISEPNYLVKFKKPIGQIRYIKFDNNGEYETDNEHIIKKLNPHFKIKLTEYKCKYCDNSFIKKGDLLVHYRKHKEDK